MENSPQRTFPVRGFCRGERGVALNAHFVRENQLMGATGQHGSASSGWCRKQKLTGTCTWWPGHFCSAPAQREVSRSLPNQWCRCMQGNSPSISMDSPFFFFGCCCCCSCKTCQRNCWTLWPGWSWRSGTLLFSPRFHDGKKSENLTIDGFWVNKWTKEKQVGLRTLITYFINYQIWILRWYLIRLINWHIDII